MFNFFNKNLRPMMDEVDSGSGGVATSQASSTDSTTDTSTSSSTDSTVSNVDQSAGTTDATSGVDTKVKQTPEQDRAYAELRRSKEAAEKRANEVESLRKRDQEIAKKYGPTYNIYSDADVEAQWGKSHGIKTVAEFEAALQKQEQEKEYKEAGIDPEVINRIINDHPDVKKAREYTAAQEAERGKQALDSDLKELSGEYPDLKLEKLEDVFKLPNSDKIYALAQKGYSLLDAYESSNKAEIRKQQAEAAKQATLNSIQGKGHLQGNGKGTEVDATRIPDDVLEMYKALNPGKTLEQYKKHYKASLK